jgi:hypothetical protein
MAMANRPATTFISGDVVTAFLAAANTSRPGTWNIGTGTETSVLDPATTIGQAAGRAVEPEFASQRPGELPRSALAVELARRDLGWSPDTPPADGVRKVYRWIEAGTPDRAGVVIHRVGFTANLPLRGPIRAGEFNRSAERLGEHGPVRHGKSRCAVAWLARARMPPWPAPWHRRRGRVAGGHRHCRRQQTIHRTACFAQILFNKNPCQCHSGLRRSIGRYCHATSTISDRH